MKQNSNKYIIISFINNIFLSILKLVIGYISKSKTLLADGVHCLSDMLTDIIGFVGNKISNKDPDESHPYGHGKAEYITSIFISVFIIVLAVKIFLGSFKPSYKIDTYYILIISLVSIISKYIVSSLLIKKGKEFKSNILITSGTESKYDIISSTLAFVFILLSIFADKLTIFKYADTTGSIIIALLTFRIGIKLFIENFNLSLGEVELNNTPKNEVKNILLGYKEIKNIRRITILKYGFYRMLIIDLEVKGSMTVNKLYTLDQDIKTKLREIHNEYKYININVRPYTNKKLTPQ